MKRKRASQADPLALPSAELMGIALEMRRIQSDEPEQFGDALPSGAPDRPARG